MSLELDKLETESDIETLQEFTNDFHDAYLCEIHYLACGTPRGRRFGVSEPDSTILRLFSQVCRGRSGREAERGALGARSLYRDEAGGVFGSDLVGFSR